MRCPFCQSPAQEDTVECSSCGFSLPKLEQFLGVPPAVTHGIFDPKHRFSRKDRRRVQLALDRFHRKFPQMGFTVFLGNIKPETPLPLYSFWLFNRSSLCASLRNGAINREIFLTIDTDNRRAGLTIGYGLEPFVGQHHLEKILEAARAELAQGAWGLATLTVIDQFTDLLAGIHAAMRRTYGAEESELGIAPPQCPQPADAAAAY